MIDAHSTLAHIRSQMRSGDRASALSAFEAEVETSDSLGPEAKLIYSLLLHLEGRRDEAAPLLVEAVKAEPDNEEWASDRALALAFLGRPGLGAAILQRLCYEDKATSVDYGRLGGIRMMLGQLENAESDFIEALEREPGRAEWHSNIGGIRARQYRLDEALEQYEKALSLNPSNTKTQNLRDNMLIALDKPQDLVTEREKEVSDNPQSVQSLLRLGRAHDLADEPEETVRAFGQAITLLQREEAEDQEEFSVDNLYLELARRMIARARYPMAFRFLKLAEDNEGEPKQIALARANIYTLNTRGTEARQELEALEEEDRQTPPVRISLAQALAEEGRYEEAEQDLRELLEAYPGNPQIRTTLAQTLMWLGRIDEAAEHFEEASRINPGALASLVDIGDIPNDPQAIDRMERFANNPFVADAPRGSMAFGLAKVYDKRKEFDSAFEWLREANIRTGKTVRYNPDNQTKYIDGLIEAFTPETFERLKGTGVDSRRPVFVCGMPRSGTTLTEQILGSHHSIFPAGELPLMASIVGKLPRVLQTRTTYPWNVEQFKARTIRHAAKYYLKHLDPLDDELPFVVDKMPHNFLHLGFIALMFPNASIIHMNRDPRDTAVSNYQQNFRAKHGMLGYSIDLEWTAQHINDYHRLMEHWRRVLPIPMFDLSYEALVQDQEATTRQLLDFIGVDWDDSVIDFHKTERAVRTASVTQVRQKIYSTSKKKWKRYEDHLGPLLDNLNQEVTEPWDNPTEDNNPYENKIVRQGEVKRL